MGLSRMALVVGTGTVGRATAAALERTGCVVYGFDPDPRAARGFPGRPFDVSASPLAWSLIAICVPTPTTDGAMDATALREAIRFAAGQAAPGDGFTAIAIRSTVVPGTMESIVAPAVGRLVAAGRAGLCYWPSFARERFAVADELSPRLALFGTDRSAPIHEAMRAHMPPAAAAPRFVSFVEAELVKHGANLFNALKISYFNAMSDWAAGLGGEGQSVADAVAAAAEGNWNPEYGTRVGPPFDGACLPKDLDALAALIAQSGLPHGALLAAIREINQSPMRQRE